MAVAREDTGTNEVNFSGVTTVTLSSLTVGTGSNRYLVALLNLGVAGVSGVGITWNSVAMTQVTSSPVLGADENAAYLFALTNPASGNNSLVATWTGGTSGVLAAIEFSGVNQTTPVVDADTVTDSTTESSSSHAITSATGDATLGMGCGEKGVQTMSSVNQTQIYLDNGASRVAAGNYALGGTSNTHTITYSASGAQTSMFIHIQAAGAAASVVTPRLLALLGVGT